MLSLPHANLQGLKAFTKRGNPAAAKISARACAKVLGLAMCLLLSAAGMGLAQKNGIQGDFAPLGSIPSAHSLSKVEYVEYFNFQCPHCNALHQASGMFFSKYSKRLKIRFVPVLFPNQQDDALRLYYVAERFKKASAVRKLIFDSQFKYRVDINDKDIIVQLAKLAKLSKEYAEHAKSSWVEKKLRKDAALTAQVGLRATPTVVLHKTIKMTPKAGAIPFLGRIEAVVLQLLKR